MPLPLKAILSLPLLLLFACNSVSGIAEVESDPPSHQQWDALLHTHVSDKGQVNYQGFIADSLQLNAYLATLEANHPTGNWSEQEQLAYWINAYNAYTVQLIIRHYPVESIKDIGGAIYKVNTAWDIRFIHIGDQTYDLNNIEHSILRKQFEEPRIHFAINCASESCPWLSNEAYTPEKLNQQLDQATREYINNPFHNTLSLEKAELSRIFKWFKGDFTKNGSLVDFINQYAEIELPEDVDINYLDYSWYLNE